jgi:glycosyltransferase involved in cell wall biosynthesis
VSSSTEAGPIPRVSVLMPMRNAEPFVREAVDSVLQQDLADLELLVVDDGSTDRSAAIATALGDPRVRIVAGPCRGFAAAWNTALERAAGELVLQCDSDDALAPGRLASQVRFLDQHPEFGAVCGGFTTIDAAGRVVAALWAEGAAPEEITAELLAGVTRTHFCTFTVRRSLLVALGGMRPFFETGCDIDLQLRLAERCRVWYEPADRYRYRLHGASITHNQPSGRRRFFEEYARELRAQRAAGGPDDLQRGVPRDAPAPDATRDGHHRHIQGMLIGEAWRMHGRGAKLDALRLGLRAIAQSPTSAETWRSVAALALKSAGPGSRS